MYEITREDYGLRCRVAGTVTVEEVAAIFHEMEDVAEAFGGSFAFLLDRRELVELEDGTMSFILRGFTKMRTLGVRRIASVRHGGHDRFQRFGAKVARLAGLADGVRYFNSEDPDWEEKARAWLLQKSEDAERSRLERWASFIRKEKREE